MIAWRGMPAPNALAEAAGRLGRTIAVETVASNEELEAMLGTERPFDLIFPSDYLVERLRDSDALIELDLAAGSRGALAGWARELEFDPACRWSIPFAYGTTGYLLDAEAAPDTGSWSALFDPPGGCRVGMLAETRELVGAALIACGRDPNDTTAEALAEARALLEAQSSRVARYDSDDFVGPVVRGELAAHHAWSGPAAHAARSHRRLRYVVPEEGAVLWVTTGAVPSEAPEPALAMALITELMDPALAVRSTVEFGFATPIEAARSLLPAALRDDVALFPDAATLGRCRVLHDLGADEDHMAAALPSRARSRTKAAG